MKIKHIAAVLLTAALLLLFCGCDLLSANTDELLSPPAPLGDLYPISEAIKSSAPDGYVLKYPSLGEYRSAVVTEDIDGDGVNEGFAFYGTTDGETSTMYINLIKKKGEKWKSVAFTSLEASGIERIDFCDLDGDGIKEILAGFEVYGASEKRVGVYSLGGDNITERFLERYTNFLCADVDGDGRQDLFLQLLDTKEGTNRARLYGFDSETVTDKAGTTMDGSVKSAPNITAVNLNGKKAVFVDEVKGVGSLTEVLLMKDGKLENPLLDKSSLENTATMRNTNLVCTDVNKDNIPEIPVSAQMPTVDSGDEKVYYTNWCSFDGEKLTVQTVTVMNTADGYVLEIPAKYVGSLAVKKDTKNKTRTFYYYDAENSAVGEELFSLTVYGVSEYDKQKTAKTFKIAQNDTSVFAATANANAEPLCFSQSDIKALFKLQREFMKRG